MSGLPVPPTDGATSVRQALDAVGYDEAAVLGRLGLPQAWTYLPAWRPLLLADLPSGPLEDAIRLLFLNEPLVDAPAWAERLSAFIVWPYRGLRLVSDPPGPRGMHLTGPRLPMRDRVFPVDASTDLLLQATLPIHSQERVLDLGCGTGVLSLWFAKQGATVVGTDINPRCLQFAAFNAQLNDVASATWLQGDMLAPVQGQRFDRVVSNLPFVPTPGSHAFYWDGGHRGQDLVARLLRGLHEVLEPGGVAQFTAGLVNPSSEDALATLSAWLGDPSMSILALYGTPQEMSRSIPLLATSEADPHEPDYPAAVARWRDAARASGVIEVAPAVITVRHDGAGMRAAFPMSPSRADFGAAVARLLSGWSRLRDLSNHWDAWRGVHLAPAGAVQLIHEVAWDGQDWGPRPARVHFADRPWRLPQTLGRDSVRIIRLCDGLRSLDDVVFAFCMQADKSPAAVRKRLLEALPTWISSGILDFA